MKYLYLFLTCIFVLVPSRAHAQIQTRDVATDLAVPWEIIWGPDNWIWFTERAGRISRVNPATGEKLLLVTISDVSQVTESGLLGMALHPGFADTPHVFVVYTYGPSNSLREKLVRYTYNGTALVNPTTLLDSIPGSSTHDGSRLVILPDRTLLMTTGDAQNQAAAQNHTSRNGKILRVNLDGSAPADNPFASAPYPANILWTTGHRNPQGLVYASNGVLYSSEHGPSTNDEINIIAKGRNYGWPNVHGFCNDGGAAEAQFCTDSNVVEPIKAWTPTIAPAGIDYYNNPAIPEWQNSLLMVTLNSVGSDLRLFKLNPAGTQITSETILYDNTWGRLRDLCIAPDGRVFISTSNRDGRGTPRNGDDRIIELRAAVSSATITTGAITPTQLQAGQTLAISFTVTGTFNIDNVFTAQLSDMNGSFTSPTTLGTVADTGSGSVNVLIPCDLEGNNFRIRVISSNPFVIGSDNGADLSIINGIIAEAGPSIAICRRDSTQLSAAVSENALYYWSPAEGLSCVDCRNPIASPFTTTTYTLRITSPSGCTDTDTVTVAVLPLPEATITRDGTMLTASAATAYQWWHNGAPISGATGQQHTATANGWYKVVVTGSNGCSGESDSVEVTSIAGVADMERADVALRLFPDPAKDQLTIEAMNLPRGITVVRVIDLSGKVVLDQQQMSSGGSLSRHLDISLLPSGAYLLEVQAGEQRWQRKFIRE
jgi:aldose sugar dehydrogenase